ncbi:MAG: hypothetical protein LBQ57_06220 [Spirochaetales bacterium]|jgi:hypothetical protein|nr:hypothetical protein [Spirochaetales bacterium]
MKKFSQKDAASRRMRAVRLLCVLAAGAFLPVSCAEDTWESLMTFNSEELRPPRLEKVVGVETDVFEAHFDKDTWVEPASLQVYPDLAVRSFEDGAPVVRIVLEEGGRPGQRYTLELSVRDARGNTCSFLYHFYGYNPRIPGMLINEVLVNTPSTTAYNQVEIIILADGDMGGVTLFEGTKSYADKTFIFPSLEVRQGDFILVHFNTVNAEGEVNETGGSKTAATGKGFKDTAWDFWLPETGNLTKDNETLSLYTNPEGDLIDGLLYTSRVYEAGAKYNGFGTSLMLNKAQELVSGGGWLTAGEDVFPQDGFDPTGATSTRTICRDSLSTDTDTAADWHIVPAGKRSPGAVNSDEVYK